MAQGGIHLGRAGVVGVTSQSDAGSTSGLDGLGQSHDLVVNGTTVRRSNVEWTDDRSTTGVGADLDNLGGLLGNHAVSQVVANSVGRGVQNARSSFNQTCESRPDWHSGLVGVGEGAVLVRNENKQTGSVKTKDVPGAWLESKAANWRGLLSSEAPVGPCACASTGDGGALELTG